jgi:hypothetical protein
MLGPSFLHPDYSEQKLGGEVGSKERERSVNKTEGESLIKTRNCLSILSIHTNLQGKDLPEAS